MKSKRKMRVMNLKKDEEGWLYFSIKLVEGRKVLKYTNYKAKESLFEQNKLTRNWNLVIKDFDITHYKTIWGARKKIYYTFIRDYYDQLQIS